MTGCVVALGAAGTWAATPSDALVSVQGTSESEYLGQSVAAVGDLDGDDVPDFAVGSPGGGYALVVSGASGKTIHTLSGSSSDEFGFCVAGVPDLDGDGVGDVLVGSPSEYNGKSQTGAAHLYSGSSGKLITSFYGDNSGDYFGCSVAGVDDLDGDGYGDFIVGARYAIDTSRKGSPAAGMVRAFHGNSGKTWFSVHGTTAGDDFGASVSGTGGDVDGDGTPDFIVGAEYGDYVKVLSGASGKEYTTLKGDASGDSFGASVGFVPDLDGDKVPELFVGAPAGADPKGNYYGYARLYSGSSTSTIDTFYGEADSEGFGASVAGIDDVNEDGTADLLVGAPWATNESGDVSGVVRILSGADGTTLDTLEGGAADDAFGTSVAWIGDTDGDGVPDCAVGAPYDDSGATDAGAAYLFGAGVTAGPQGTILIADDAFATSSTSVTLHLSWKAGKSEVVEMRFRDADGDWGEWTGVAETADWTLPEKEGVLVVEAQFRDEAGLESEAAADDILLDLTAPTGAVLVAGGSPWSNTAGVTLGLTYEDDGAGVTRFRARNAGDETFGAWTDVAPTANWTLSAGGGAKTVEVQYEDAAGNVSEVVSDGISVDLEAPTGGLQIAGGADVVRNRVVTLNLTSADTGGSGVSQMRLRRAGAPAWGNWTAFAATSNWSLTSPDGTKEVEAQFRDVAGNESPVYLDGVFLDEGIPVVAAFAPKTARPFYLPTEPVEFTLVASDAAGGSGLDAARTSWDNGATWTAWTDISGGGSYTPTHPALAGDVTPRVVVRDRAGNESDPFISGTLVFLDLGSPDMGSGGKGKGAMDGPGDVDAVVIDLVKGDSLSVSVKGVSNPKKQSFVLSLDLALPDGTRLVTDRHPATSKKPGIKGFVAPATGRYLLVVRNADDVGTSTGTWSISVAVKHAKANAAGKGTTTDGSFTFDAAAGSTFSATLKGAGVDPASVTVEGPDGDVPVTAKLKAGKIIVSPAALTAGTGPYTVRFTGTGSVAFTWKTKLPKPSARIEE